jgi:hypothetical protein
MILVIAVIGPLPRFQILLSGMAGLPADPGEVWDFLSILSPLLLR